MATLENGENNSKSSRRDISFELQSIDLPSKRLLGKGLSGIGYETAWKGARYARKDFVGVQRDIFLQEVTVLVGLKDHKNIVKTYGWTVDKRSCSLVLEYVDEDLLSLLQKRMDSKRGVVGKSSAPTSAQPVDPPEAVDMMLQIATGVEYLHEQGLAHGDLKTKNILVTRRKDGEQSSKVLKLSDFGLVGTKGKSRYIVSRRVRKLDMVRWKSPECLKILSRRLHSSNGDEDGTSSESDSESTPSSIPEVSSACAGTKSSDVYSFALICFHILTGQSPYPYLDWKELLFKILSGFRPDLPDSLHPLLRELLISCWGDPAERPSFSAIRLKLKRVQEFLTTDSSAGILGPVGRVPPSEFMLSQDFVRHLEQGSPTDDLVRRRASEADSITGCLEVSDTQWLEGGDTQLSEVGDTQWSELSDIRLSEVIFGFVMHRQGSFVAQQNGESTTDIGAAKTTRVTTPQILVAFNSLSRENSKLQTKRTRSSATNYAAFEHLNRRRNPNFPFSCPK